MLRKCLKPFKPIAEIEADVRRITIFISDILGKPSLGQKWMLEPRFGDKNAIEMIHDGNLGDVMLCIHKHLMPKNSTD